MALTGGWKGGTSIGMKTLFQAAALAAMGALMTLALGLAAVQSKAAPQSVAVTQAATPLQEAYALLKVADHDYKGHRVKAMKQIEAALGELGGKISSQGRNHEPQGTSDAQLRAAQGLLEQARAGLSGKALKHVQAAISQISIALSIR